MIDYEKARRRLTCFGLALSIVWSVWIIGSTWTRLESFWFKDNDLNSIGDFLAGAVAPLAFLWLVVGYFLQGLELRMQREELALQRQETQRLANEAGRQAIAIEANELHARKDAFFRASDFYVGEMLAHVIAITQRMVPIDTFERLLREMQSGNNYAMHDRLVRMKDELGKDPKRTVLATDPELRDRPQAYCKAFDELLQQAVVADPSGRLRDIYLASRLGDLDRVFKDLVDDDRPF